MKRFLFAACSSLALLSAPYAVADQATVDAEQVREFSQDNLTITWQNPKDFTDIKPANDSRKRFRDRTLNAFEQHFVELAEDLPEGQMLNIRVTDVDLAGQVWPTSFIGLGNSGSHVRLVKDVYIPRMELHYTLTDTAGQVLSEEHVKLKDMGFQQRVLSKHDHESLRYEKQMISDWFNDTFPDMVARQ